MEIFNELEERKIVVDILVNNAGVGDFGEFHNVPFQKISAMLHLNIVTLTELTKPFLRGMVERKQGSILNVASMAAYVPGPYMAVYYASKAYVKSFSQAISSELKGTGVTVTALCPGNTKTGFQREVGGENSNMAKFNLLGSSEYVAKIAVKALSEGKEVVVPGLINASLAITTRIIPSRVTTRIIRMMQELNRKKIV
jgi:short-subunit dehydrogenase